MTIASETLLPQPSSVDVSSDMTAIDTMKAGGNATTAQGVSLSTLPTSSADLFGGELGVDELNEIPSLFDLDSQQMNVDLDALGLSTSGVGQANGQSNETPFLVSSSNNSNSSSVDGSETMEESNQKRTAAEISEDDEEGQCSKARRVSCTTEPESAPSKTVTISPQPPAKRPLAPKPTSKKPVEAQSNDSSRNVDTSTSHVKALTGAKGATMCFENVSGTERDTTVSIPNLAAADLTPEEKAKFSRDRNRLHARNTRIRKKAYVDELKRTLDVLVEERDAAAAEKDRNVQIEKEERDVRFSVLEEFLRLRACNERNSTRWNAILEDGITLCLPNWDNVSAAGGGISSKKVLSGVPELMKECNDFTKEMQAGERNGRKSTGFLAFQCDRTSLLMEGSNVVVDWMATSTDPAKATMIVRGTCRACFNPQSNKIHSVEMFFDSRPIFA